MNNKVLDVAIIGVGSRGGFAYGTLINKQTDKFNIVSLCDIKQFQLDYFSKEFNVKKENCFLKEDDFFKKKRAELLIIATLDNDHVRHCIKALNVGYKNILLEKPITDSLKECEDLLKLANEKKANITVCHVLRYAPVFRKVKDLLTEENIGRLVSIQAIEQIAFYHFAHSYVRGNWRNLDVAAPMILAKSCHDLDLLKLYANSKCKLVSSLGSLTHFKKENAPKDSAKKCVDCKHVDTCRYSAKRIYVDGYIKNGSPSNDWPYNVACNDYPLNADKMYEAISKGSYGRCVYECDNNVCDNHTVLMEFENGVNATLTVMAFTGYGGRIYKFYGTLGEIDLDEEKAVVEIKRFNEEKIVLSFDDIIKQDGAHGGGDIALINDLYDIAVGNKTSDSSLEESIESHLMGIYAEKSRLENGKVYYIHKKNK